jgi:hypothetical protein
MTVIELTDEQGGGAKRESGGRGANPGGQPARRGRGR